MREAVALLSMLMVVSCVYGATDPGDVAALNTLFVDFDSNPTLTKWVSNALGDPCGDQWFGLTCEATFVTAIQLPNCGLTGKVHGSLLQQFQHVTVLDLSNNNFDSDIPEHFPPNLVELDLSNNEFSGNFPDQLMNISSLQIIKLNNNKLDDELNAQTFTTLVNVVTLDLSNNDKFSGTIPASIGDYMVSLQFLYLQNNELTGQLPTSLSNLAALQVFDCSNNELTGYLPPNFNPPTFSYQGNDIIEQAPSPPPYTLPPPSPPTSKNSSNTPTTSTTSVATSKASSSLLRGPKVAAIVVIILVALTVVAIALWFFVIRKRTELFETDSLDLEAHDTHTNFCVCCLPFFATGKDDEKPEKLNVFEPDTTKKDMEEPKIIPLTLKSEHLITKKPREKVSTTFSMAELQATTKNFSKEALVGKGTLGQVYRAEFPDGRVLAVKKLDPIVGNEKDFFSIVEGLAKLQHSNVVELVGYCVEHNQQLLVYKFLSHGTLQELLHGSVLSSVDVNKGLSWNTRVKIALGLAQALEYLHEVCSPSLVHCNVKSANILFDDELNPHLSDCGLEALVTKCPVALQKPSAIGYWYNAPEYAVDGIYSYEIDVYSFGVVMLELLTGREPLESSRPQSEQSLVQWARPHLHNIDELAKMVDPTLLGVYPTTSLSRLADIIALCLQDEPKFRPPMSEVVQSLVSLMEYATLGITELSPR